jgi:hypothetical protein
MALVTERYSFSFEVRGIARAVNASSLQVVVDGGQWPLDGGRGKATAQTGWSHISHVVFVLHGLVLGGRGLEVGDVCGIGQHSAGWPEMVLRSSL